MSEEPDVGDEQEGLPSTIVEDVERLTRLAQSDLDRTVRNTYLDRRNRLLERWGYTARMRTEGRGRGGEEDRDRNEHGGGGEGDRKRDWDGDGSVLVLHPAEWVEDGVIRPDRIDDLSRGIEIYLDGSGDDADWETVDAHNRALVASVRDEYGEVHGDNAEAFADFMGNHHANRMNDATERHVEEFLTEYYVRNAWPSVDQRAVIEDSIQLIFEVAEQRATADERD